MAGISSIDRDSTVQTIRDIFLYTWCRLQACELTQDIANEFGALWPEIQAAYQEDESLLIRTLLADATLELLDIKLDFHTDTLSSLTLNDPDARELYFKDKAPSLLKKPIAGPQLEHMSNWPATLALDAHEGRKALAEPVKLTVERAKAAEEASTAADNDYRIFRKSGTRAQIVDKLNARRIDAYSKVRAIYIAQRTAEGLPSTWAESFFQPKRARRREPTLEQLEEQIASAKAEVAALEQKRDELRADQERARKVKLEAERKAKQLRLEELNKRQELLNEEKRRLESELAQGNGSEPSGPR